MTALMYAFPEAAQFGKVIPKSKFYEKAALGGRVKKSFVEQIERIVWVYKLSPKTTNLPAGKEVEEIQIFDIFLKGESLDDEVLVAMDKAIASPLIFQLVSGSRIQVAAAYKRRSEADAEKWVVSPHFRSDWADANHPKTTLPVALDMDRLYAELIKPLVGIQPKEAESVRQLVERADAIRLAKNDITKIQARLGREKQFNKRVAINAELRVANETLKRISSDEADQQGGDRENR